ncbi:hypothetical protein POM88_030708 [Heracleum sosnowskyi]|uniref:FBD domain-containing protein n=1 Tax=Heracleum sosnowskyi TaxID=360622 RepID=A0AAD8HZ14_9APIA|nr:hypothetical protein POM88_030708 [Heracleum sosnowskyi]
MPSYLFSCSELTHLCLTNCILNPPLRFGGFSNLIEVKLEEVIITGNVLFGSHLKVLKLRFCDGIENLESQFKQNHSIINLVIQNSGEIDFTWFECTRKVQKFCLTLEREADSRKNYINLDKLVGNMTEIRILRFDGFLLKLLDPSAAVSKRIITTMKNLKHLFLYTVEFYDMVQIQHVFLLMRSSPKLRSLYIKVGSHGGIGCSLQSPNFMDMVLDHLKTVKILGLVGSRAELEFIKLLLASSPSLRRIEILNTTVNDPKEESRISRVLMQFPRASTAAQIIWT